MRSVLSRQCEDLAALEFGSAEPSCRPGLDLPHGKQGLGWQAEPVFRAALSESTPPALDSPPDLAAKDIFTPSPRDEKALRPVFSRYEWMMPLIGAVWGAVLAAILLILV